MRQSFFSNVTVNCFKLEELVCLFEKEKGCASPCHRERVWEEEVEEVWVCPDCTSSPYRVGSRLPATSHPGATGTPSQVPVSPGFPTLSSTRSPWSNLGGGGLLGSRTTLSHMAIWMLTSTGIESGLRWSWSSQTVFLKYVKATPSWELEREISGSVYRSRHLAHPLSFVPGLTVLTSFHKAKARRIWELNYLSVKIIKGRWHCILLFHLQHGFSGSLHQPSQPPCPISSAKLTSFIYKETKAQKSWVTLEVTGIWGRGKVGASDSNTRAFLWP